MAEYRLYDPDGNEVNYPGYAPATNAPDGSVTFPECQGVPQMQGGESYEVAFYGRDGAKFSVPPLWVSGGITPKHTKPE